MPEIIIEIRSLSEPQMGITPENRAALDLSFVHSILAPSAMGHQLQVSEQRAQSSLLVPYVMADGWWLMADG